MKTAGIILISIGVVCLVVGMVILGFGHSTEARFYIVSSVLLNTIGITILRIEKKK